MPGPGRQLLDRVRAERLPEPLRIDRLVRTRRDPRVDLVLEAAVAQLADQAVEPARLLDRLLRPARVAGSAAAEPPAPRLADSFERSSIGYLPVTGTSDSVWGRSMVLASGSGPRRRRPLSRIGRHVDRARLCVGRW